MYVVIYMNVNQINIITLAYLGDAVYEVYIRNHLINTGIAKVEDLQREAIRYVSAKNQKKASFCHTSIIIGDILHFSIKKPGMCLTTHTCFPIKHLLLIKKEKTLHI